MDVMDDAGLRTPTSITGRCETCGAQAYLTAQVNGTDLNYCGHHGTKYFDRLTEQGRITLDLRHQIPKT